MTMVAGLGKCSGLVSPDVGLNAYAEVGIQKKWLLMETGLKYWRIIYPLVIVLSKTVPALWKLYRERLKCQNKVLRMQNAKQELKQMYVPWDGNVSSWIYQDGPCTPSDASAVFFRGIGCTLPPTQESNFCPILEDPMYGESPCIWDEEGGLICMAVKSGEDVEVARFDTDLGTCGIDNRASASMSPHKADFKEALMEEKRVIWGFEGEKVYTIYKGTLVIPIEDDKGKLMKSKFQTCTTRLHAPTVSSVLNIDWAQEVKDTTDDGTGCIPYSDRAILFWQGGTRKKTFALPSRPVRVHKISCYVCDMS
jgi:hypothetical protein